MFRSETNPPRPGYPLGCLILIMLLSSLGAPATVAEKPAEPDTGKSEDVADQGVVTYRVSYEGMGAMGAMLPKEETVYFHGQRMVVDMGMQKTYVDREAGVVTSLMDLGSTKAAFRYPVTEEEETDFEYEYTDEIRSFDGVEARRVDIVDVTDPNNRLPVWTTSKFTAEYSHFSGLEGFLLESTMFMNGGERHSVAEKIELRPVDPAIFEIPTDYTVFELESAEEMPAKIQELAAGAQLITADSPAVHGGDGR